jgi:outer membrane protein assembly factor BamE (lipoprotein component of BamABCDE complex)
MKTILSKVLLGAALAASLGAHAQYPSYGRTGIASQATLDQIHSGLTRDDVLAIAGKPTTVTGAGRDGTRVWEYDFIDDWGYKSEFDVTLNGDGVVQSTFSDRDDY